MVVVLGPGWVMVGFDGDLSLRQASEQAVTQVGETHRNSISVIKLIGECLLKECVSWKAQMVALRKAKETEEKVTAKAVEKARQAEQKRVEKEQKTREKAQEAEAAKASEIDAETEQEDPKKKKSRKPRNAGLTSVDASDPAVLQEIGKFQAGNVSCLASVGDFITHIISQPATPCIARLKKAMYKKVLQEETQLSLIICFFG